MEKPQADYFERKRRELGMDREHDLEMVQAVLDKWYPGMARAKRFHLGVLRVVTPSSAVASAIRLRQLELFEACGLDKARLAISVAI